MTTCITVGGKSHESYHVSNSIYKSLIVDCESDRPFD